MSLLAMGSAKHLLTIQKQQITSAVCLMLSL